MSANAIDRLVVLSARAKEDRLSWIERRELAALRLQRSVAIRNDVLDILRSRNKLPPR